MTININDYNLPKSLKIMREGKLVDVPIEEVTDEELEQYAMEQIRLGESIAREGKSYIRLGESPNHGPVIVFKGGTTVAIPPEAITDQGVMMAIRPMEPNELSAKRGLKPGVVIEFQGGKKVIVPPEATDGNQVFMELISGNNQQEITT